MYYITKSFITIIELMAKDTKIKIYDDKHRANVLIKVISGSTESSGTRRQMLI